MKQPKVKVANLESIDFSLFCAFILLWFIANYLGHIAQAVEKIANQKPVTVVVKQDSPARPASAPLLPDVRQWTAEEWDKGVKGELR